MIGLDEYDSANDNDDLPATDLTTPVVSGRRTSILELLFNHKPNNNSRLPVSRSDNDNSMFNIFAENNSMTQHSVLSRERTVTSYKTGSINTSNKKGEQQQCIIFSLYI